MSARQALRLLPRLCAALALATALPAADAASPAGLCASPGVPGGATATWVAPQIGVDGVPMAIVMLRAPQPAAAVLDWYAHHWAALNPRARPLRYTVGAWKVIARRIGGCFETVQAQAADGGGTLAYVGVSRSQGMAAAPAPDPALPSPAGAQTLLSMDSQDAGRHGQTLLLALPMDLRTARAYYRHALAARGWAVQMNHMPTATQAALMAQRHATKLEIAFSNVQGRTYALLTTVEN